MNVLYLGELIFHKYYKRHLLLKFRDNSLELNLCQSLQGLRIEIQELCVYQKLAYQNVT